MTTPIDFDAEKLRQFFASNFGTQNECLLERVIGGQSNPTYFLNWGGQQLVLRKQPNGEILRGAHAIDREYKVLTALHPEGFPVPKPVLYHDDHELIGTPFYLMQRVEGRVFEDCSLPGIAADERHALWMALADTLADMHNIVPEDVGLGDFGRPGNYFVRQIKRWESQWLAAQSDSIPELDHLLSWLKENLPEDDNAICLTHGDFRMGNMLFHPTEPKVVAVLDWELSTLGHPMADLGFCAMPWHTSTEEYGGILGLDLPQLGLPHHREFVGRYFEKSRFDMPLLPFHPAFALFRFAVIFVGISERARNGNAADENAARLAPLARRFAIRGMNIIERFSDNAAPRYP